MKILFEVLNGTWTEVAGTILGDGRLAYAGGFASPPFWRHSESTVRDPLFREHCFDNLDRVDQELAVARLGGRPSF